MKRYTKTVLFSLALCLLCGCTGGQQSSSNAESSDTTESSDAAQVTDTTAPAVSYEAEKLPVISIVTENKDANVLDFVKEPVAPHVSEAIASWTPGYVIPPAPYYEACSVTVTDENEQTVLSGVPANVKVRGNWTTVYDKKPLRIQFDEKQSMLGMNGGAELRNWVLLAEYKDASMLRDKTALYVAREMLEKDGLYAADAKFAEVYINDQYWGLYLLSEQQQINSDRVDITEAEPDYQGTDIGYFMEFDGYYEYEEPLQQFRVEYADNAALTPYDGNGGSGREMKCLKQTPADPKKDIGITIKSDIYSQEQHDFIASYVNNVYQIMYEAAYNDKAFAFNADYTEIAEDASLSPQQAVENAVDVQSLADIYLLSELTCDADIYWSSFFMDVDFGAEGSKKLTFEAPWDFDSGMGNKDRCADGTGFYAANIVPDVDGGTKGGGQYDSINPWLAVLMYEDWYQDIIRETWTKAYDDGIFERAADLIAHDTAAYADAFDENYKKWDNIRHNESFVNELANEAKWCKTQAEAAEYLEKWFTARVKFMNEQWHK